MQRKLSKLELQKRRAEINRLITERKNTKLIDKYDEALKKLGIMNKNYRNFKKKYDEALVEIKTLDDKIKVLETPIKHNENKFESKNSGKTKKSFVKKKTSDTKKTTKPAKKTSSKEPFWTIFTKNRPTKKKFSTNKSKRKRHNK